MARKANTQPTDVEMEILNVLWEQGPSTLGELHASISTHRKVAYTTTRKMTQIMREKGLIKSSGSAKPLIYSAAKSKSQTCTGMVNDLAKRAFGGSAKNLMLSMLSSKSISDEDLAEIQRMIRAERNKND